MLEKKLRRYRLMDIHKALVAGGKLEVARLILALLRDGKIVLWLDDVSCAAERICEDAGCEIFYSGNGNRATAHV